MSFPGPGGETRLAPHFWPGARFQSRQLACAGSFPTLGEHLGQPPQTGHVWRAGVLQSVGGGSRSTQLCSCPPSFWPEPLASVLGSSGVGMKKRDARAAVLWVHPSYPSLAFSEGVHLSFDRAPNTDMGSPAQQHSPVWVTPPLASLSSPPLTSALAAHPCTPELSPFLLSIHSAHGKISCHPPTPRGTSAVGPCWLVPLVLPGEPLRQGLPSIFFTGELSLPVTCPSRFAAAVAPGRSLGCHPLARQFNEELSATLY